MCHTPFVGRLVLLKTSVLLVIRQVAVNEVKHIIYNLDKREFKLFNYKFIDRHLQNVTTNLIFKPPCECNCARHIFPFIKYNFC